MTYKELKNIADRETSYIGQEIMPDDINDVYVKGFEKALELVLSNDMITEIPDCESIKELITWLSE